MCTSRTIAAAYRPLAGDGWPMSVPAVDTHSMRIIRTQHAIVREAGRWWFDAKPPAEADCTVRYVDWPSESMPNAYVTWIVDDR
jgi:hypothetical protein